MTDSSNFEEYRKFKLKIRNLTKKFENIEKERADLRRKKAMENYFNNGVKMEVNNE